MGLFDDLIPSAGSASDQHRPEAPNAPKPDAKDLRDQYARALERKDAQTLAGAVPSNPCTKMRRMIRAALSGCYAAGAARITVDLESRRRGSPICALARKLLEAGHDLAAELHVYRGDTLCFRPAPLAKWAGLVIEEGDNTRKSARFAKYRLPNPQPARETDDFGLGRSTGHPALSGGQASAAPEPAPVAAWHGPSSGLAVAASASPAIRGAAPPVQSLAWRSDDEAA